MTKLTLLTQADVMTRIDTLGVAARALQADIHLCAVSALDHVRAHGDTRGACALMNALPNGQRVKSLGVWFNAFSGGKLALTQNKDTKAWEANLSKDRSDSDFDVAGAEATDYGAFTKEIAPQTMTLLKLVKKLEGFSTNDETNTDGSPKVDSEARAMAAELVAQVRVKMIKAAA